MTDNQNDDQAQYQIGNHLIAITIFPNYGARTRETWDMTLPEIGDMILSENRKGGEAGKGRLPWLKLAEFGDVPNPKTKSRSLRYDANVLKISGVEVDHDSGRPIAEAIEQLRAAGIRALVYTSPSYLLLPDKGDGTIKEKWRVLAPTSGPLDPGQRAGLMARLNGVLKGAATAESFALSQSFYYGSVDRNPKHRVEIIDGEFIDRRGDLDAGAIGSPGPAAKKRKQKTGKADADAAPSYSDAEIDEMLALCKKYMHTPEMGWRTNMRAVTASLVGKMWTDEAIRERCGPSCIDGEYDDDLTKLIDTARVRYGTSDPGEDAEFRELLAQLEAEAVAAGEAPFVASVAPAPSRKPVVIRYGDLDVMVDQAAQALIKADVPFYQRGGRLVRPVVLDVKSFNDAPSFTSQLVEVTQHYMRDTLSREMRWVKYSKTENRWVNANPPMDVALTLLDKFGDWPFRVLAGIITTQTLRPDGSILSDAGYDEPTQLLLINPPPMQPIPEQPTRADAEAALALLKDLISEFPFAWDDEAQTKSVSRAVGLSAIISVVCRGGFPVQPMHAIDAPAAGTGKSYLLSTVSWVSTGQPMPVMSAGKTKEETEKRLGAAVIAGQTMICIDNVEGELGGDTLCQLIEQPRPSVRILGQSTLVEVDGRSTSMFCNGNNITLLGDVYRRVVMCRLDRGEERPEKHQFKQDPRRMVLADRGAYVAACLTIARAYQAAGRPGRCAQIASFNEWSDTVRSALVWLGELDVVTTQDNAKAEDPHTISHQLLMTAWHGAFGGRLMLVRDVIEKANEKVAGASYDTTGSMRFVYDELRSAIQATNPEAHRKDIDAHAFGQKLRHLKDRWVGGMRLTQRKTGDEVLWNAEIQKDRPVLKRKKLTEST